MTERPLVSIVTPSFNQGRFIEATIESVLAQDYPRIEYIVVDGGSTDGTLEVLKRYEGRLTWSSEPDRGQAHAINKGFRRARGEILAWLNSDDTYLPGAVGAAVEHLGRHPECAMVYGEGFLIDESGDVIRRFPATEPFNLWKLVYLSDFILQQTTFFRRATLEAVGGLDESLHWALDWDLFIKIGKRFRVDYLPRDMANLREYRSAKTLSGGRKRLAELTEVMRRHGRHRYPPGVLSYGLDTYFRLLFHALEDRVPRPLARLVPGFHRTLQRAVYGLVGRFIRDAQGFYRDGWAGRRAHFLIPNPAAAATLTVKGAVPESRPRGILRLQAIANGHRLGTRRLSTPGRFEAVWSLPPELRRVELLEVELRSRPAVRPSRVPLIGDRRRLAFRLEALGVREADPR